MSPRAARIVQSSVSALLGTLLAISVVLPWFELPILGYMLPAPAWSKAGIACFVLAALLFLRAVLGAPLRWLVRPALIPSVYLWWNSVQATRAWGAETLAPAQIKLVSVNRTLTTLGGDDIRLYDPALWKNLEPSFGWKFAGVVLFSIGVATLLDGSFRRKCQSCGTKGRDQDSFCCKCGQSLTQATVCGNCGETARDGDNYCRHCSKSLRLEAQDTTS